MKLLLIFLLLGGLAILPFAFLKKPWAIRLWKRLRLIVVIYVIVIFISAVVRLVLNWDDIYG